jgi:hypothetical protein
MCGKYASLLFWQDQLMLSCIQVLPRLHICRTEAADHINHKLQCYESSARLAECISLNIFNHTYNNNDRQADVSGFRVVLDEAADDQTVSKRCDTRLVSALRRVQKRKVRL